MVRFPPRWSLALAVLGVTALAGVLAVGGVLAPDVGSVGGEESTPTPAPTPAPVPTDTPDATTPAAGLAGVPGVSEIGIVDPAAFARHHDRTLGSNYTLWMDLYWRSAADLTDGWHQRDVDVAVAGERSHLRAEVEPASGAERRPVLEVYRDGDARYTAVYDDAGTPTVRRLAPDEDSPSRVPTPAALRSTTLARLLDTPLTAYTGRVEREGESFHRVVATGAPSGTLPTPDRGFVPSTAVPSLAADLVARRSRATAVRNYSAVVLFDDEGHLESVETWYTLVDSPDPIAVRFRVVYDRRGTTTVTRPSWVDAGTAERDAFRDDNG